jgi:hypothetical protein
MMMETRAPMSHELLLHYDDVEKREKRFASRHNSQESTTILIRSIALELNRRSKAKHVNGE